MTTPFIPSYAALVGEVPHSGIDIKKLEEMGSDIDKLKQTLDVAFRKIQNALFFGDMGSREHQWKMTTEKDIMSVLVKSYMREFQEKIEAEVMIQGKQVLKRWLEHWSELMNEVTKLRHELGTFIIQNELVGTYDEESRNNSITTFPFSQENITGHDDDRSKGSLENMDVLPNEEEGNEDGSNFVAKMVKKHQSIIRQKSQELNVVLLQEKRVSPTKKEKEHSRVKERIQNITERLDNLINWNCKVSESVWEERVFDDEVNKDECTLESAWEKIKGVIFSSENAEKDDERSVLNKGNNDKTPELRVQSEGTSEKFYCESLNLDKEKQVEEGVCRNYLNEAINEWNERIERNSIEIENTIREDVGMLVTKKMVEEYNKTLENYNASMEYRVDEIRECFRDHLQLLRIESLLKEDLFMVVQRGMLEEWKVELDNYIIENLIREQLFQLIMVETMKNNAIVSSMEVKSLVQDKTIDDFTLSNTMLNQVHEVPSEDQKLIKTLLESLLTCFEVEESLMLSVRSEIKEHSQQLDLGSERGELHEHEILEDLLIGEEETFSSLTSKVEKALQQLGISKTLLSELITTLSLRERNQTTIGEEEEQLKLSYSDFLRLLNILQTLVEFEGIVTQKLEKVSMRYIFNHYTNIFSFTWPPNRIFLIISKFCL